MSQAGIVGTAGGGGGSAVDFLAGNTGGNVGPNVSGVINVVGAGLISVAGNPATNTLTISASSTISLTITNVNHAASPYSVLSTDQFLAVNSTLGTVTINLPNTTTTGRVIYIKDSNGTSAVSNITITTTGGTVDIDGSTTYVISTNYQAVSLIFDGTGYEVF